MYGRFEISSTTGKDERNDFESWEIPDINKNIDMTVSESTPEAQLDRKDVAGSCMIESFSVYADPDCSQEIPMDNGTLNFFLWLGNKEI